MNKILASFLRPIWRSVTGKKFRSREYWEKRYTSGGNSGAGSYGRLAVFKAEIINRFVKLHGIRSVLDLGCGDGNQVALFEIPRYTGLDVSPFIVDMCRKRFAADPAKSFFLYDLSRDDTRISSDPADLTISLDVIYHLTEDAVFERYMQDLFDWSGKYVIIYSSDTGSQDPDQAEHVFHRKFSDWIVGNRPEWTQVEKIRNRYPWQGDGEEESMSDFYIYRKSPDHKTDVLSH